MTVVYTRREDINAKRFLTLPKAALDRWPIVTRRVTSDLDTDLVVADEIVRGLSRSALYRSLPFGVYPTKTLFIAGTRVPRTSATVAMIICEADVPEGDHDQYAAVGRVDEDGFTHYENDEWPDEVGEILGF